MAQTTIDLQQSEFCRMMVQRIKDQGHWTEGTYNRQDPTKYERGSATIDVEYGYTLSAPDHEIGEPGGYPLEETIEISFVDSTWGVEFEFRTSIGKVEGYFDRGDKEWCRCHPRFFEVFKDILLAESTSMRNRRENMAELRRYE